MYNATTLEYFTMLMNYYRYYFQSQKLTGQSTHSRSYCDYGFIMVFVATILIITILFIIYESRSINPLFYLQSYLSSMTYQLQLATTVIIIKV